MIKNKFSLIRGKTNILFKVLTLCSSLLMSLQKPALPLFCLFLIVLGMPIHGLAQTTDTGVSGSWVGVYWARPDLYEVEIEITQHPSAAGAVLTDLTGELINFPTSLVKSAQQTTPYKYSITGKLDPKTGYVTLRAKRLLEPEGGRRAVYPFYGIYDRNTDSLVGFMDVGRQEHGLDLPIYCVRASQKETLSDFIRQIAGVDEKDVEQQRIKDKNEVLSEQRRVVTENSNRRNDNYAQANALAKNQRKAENLKRQIGLQKNIIRKADKQIAKGGNSVARAKKKKAKAETKLKAFESELADVNATIGPAPVLPPVPSDNLRNQLVRDLERILSVDNLQSRYRGVNAFIAKHERDLSKIISGRSSIDELEKKISKDTRAIESGDARNPLVQESRIEKNKGKLQKALAKKAAYESVLKDARQARSDMEGIITQHDEEVARIRENIIPWTSLLKKEYPDVDFSKAGYPASLYARNLFEDVHFTKYFQESYLKLTADKQKDYAQSISHGLEGDQRSAYLEIRFLNLPFKPASRENYALKIYLRVREGLRPWLDLTRAVLNQVTAHRNAFEEILVIEAAFEAFRPSCWPSELAGIPEGIVNKRRNLADPVLGLKVKDALQGASTLEHAQGLNQWQSEWPEVYKWASSSAKTSSGKEVSRRIDKIVRPLIAKEVSRIKGFGQGVDALRKDCQWLQSFENQFGFVAERDYFFDAVQTLRKRRAEDLKASVSAILNEIERCSNSHRVEELLRITTSVPGDETSEVGRTIIAAAYKRFKQLSMKRLYSPYELSLMKDWMIEVPAKPSPPTSLEVGLAYLREYAHVTGGQVLDHHTAKASTLLGQLLNLYAKVHISDVTLLSWTQDNLNEVSLPERVRAAMAGFADEELSQMLAVPAGETSYWCMYSVKTGIDLPKMKNVFGQDNSNHPVMKMLSGSYGSQQAVVFVDVVRLTKDGWRSASARNRFTQRREEYNKKIQEMNSNKPTIQYFVW